MAPSRRPIGDVRSRKAPYVAPRTAIEARLAAIWAEVLKRDQVSVEDDFFDLGGDSLRATMVAARVRRAFGVESALVALFEGRTVAKLAVAIAESVPRDPPEISGVVASAPASPRPGPLSQDGPQVLPTRPRIRDSAHPGPPVFMSSIDPAGRA